MDAFGMPYTPKAIHNTMISAPPVPPEDPSQWVINTFISANTHGPLMTVVNGECGGNYFDKRKFFSLTDPALKFDYSNCDPTHWIFADNINLPDGTVSF